MVLPRLGLEVLQVMAALVEAEEVQVVIQMVAIGLHVMGLVLPDVMEVMALEQDLLAH
jgi:hypothetical protein